jgi:Protein of unknown function (DUF1580)
MIDLQNETILSIAQAAKRLPPGRNSKPTHVSTVLRWILKGHKGVRPEATRIGGRWVTSAEAIQRFSDNLTAATMPQAMANITQPRLRRAELAEAELDKLGF